MSINKILIERILADLSAEPYFSGFKILKSKSYMIFKTPEIKRIVGLGLGFDINSHSQTLIRPYYEIRFDVLFKWFERYSPYDIQSQRDECVISLNGKDIGRPLCIYFNDDMSDYEYQYAVLRDEIIKCSEYVSCKYDTLGKCYVNILKPVLDGNTEMPKFADTWIFRDLTLCKIVAPDQYPILKEKYLQLIELTHQKNEPNLAVYYDRLPEIFADLETRDFSIPVKIPKNEIFSEIRKAEAKKNARVPPTAEQQKMIDSTRKAIAKKYGFQQRDYCNWMVKDGYYFSVVNLIDKSYIEVKPLYVDDLYWEIFEAPSLKNAPMSFRAIGAFVVPDECLHTYPAPFSGDSTDRDYTEENAIKQWDNIFRQINDVVEQFLKENPDAESFDIKKRERGGQIPRLMMLCHHERYDEALQLIDEETKAGRSSSVKFSMPDGSHKDAHDLIREYCERQLQQQNKDKKQKLLHFLFRRNK